MYFKHELCESFETCPPGMKKDGTPHFEPIFAKPSADGELWVPLLEKAFAKRAGSYDALNLGEVSWALQSLTGEPRQQWYHSRKVAGEKAAAEKAVSAAEKAGAEKPAPEWQLIQVDIEKQRQRMEERAKDAGCSWIDTGQKHVVDAFQFFESLRRGEEMNFVMSACIAGDVQRSDGLIPGHSYSLLTAKDYQDHRRA